MLEGPGYATASVYPLITVSATCSSHSNTALYSWLEEARCVNAAVTCIGRIKALNYTTKLLFH